MLLLVGLSEWEPCVPTLDIWTLWEEEQMTGIGLPWVGGGPGYRSALLVSRTCRLYVLVLQTQMPQSLVSPGALARVWGAVSLPCSGCPLCHLLSPDPHLPLLPSLSCFLLTPLPTSCSPWLGQAGQALGVSSFLPAHGKGVAVGQEGEGTPFCSAL